MNRYCRLVAHRLVQKKGTKIELSPLARVMSEHFIGIERLLEIMRLVGEMDNPLDIIAELESEGMEKEPEKRERRSRTGKRKDAGDGEYSANLAFAVVAGFLLKSLFSGWEIRARKTVRLCTLIF